MWGRISKWGIEFDQSDYLPIDFPKSAHSERMYVPLEHVTRKIRFCL